MLRTDSVTKHKREAKTNLKAVFYRSRRRILASVLETVEFLVVWTQRTVSYPESDRLACSGLSRSIRNSRLACWRFAADVSLVVWRVQIGSFVSLKQ